MMKKFIYSFIAAGTMLTMTSCASDMPEPIAGEGMTFVIQLPADLNSRATFGDETKATLDNLQWTIYENYQGVWRLIESGSKTNAFADSQTEETVTLNLLKKKTYKVVFFADNKENGYASFADGIMSVNYTDAPSNNKDQDAFVGVSDEISIAGATTKSVTLRRPYAQLNWGTNDLSYGVVRPYLNILKADVKVIQGLYQSYDVLNNKFLDPVANVTFKDIAINNLPEENFPVAGYKLVAMNYLLTGKGSIDCSLNYNKQTGLTPVVVNNVQVNANFRTNIYGSLLTEPGTFNILIDTDWEKPDNNVTPAPAKASGTSR